jgi:hypothetical protein
MLFYIKHSIHVYSACMYFFTTFKSVQCYINETKLEHASMYTPHGRIQKSIFCSNLTAFTSR